MTPPTSADKQIQACERLVPTVPDLMLDAGVMHLFVRYLHQIGILETIQALFGSMRKSNKGLSVAELFKQMFCFLIDPENRFLVDFDRLKKDARYAAIFGGDNAPMASSHAIKRFYRAFTWPGIFRFRHLLHQLFVWRLHLNRPETLFLSIPPAITNQRIFRHRNHERIAGDSTGMEIHAYSILWGPFTVDATLRPKNIATEGGNPYTKMLPRVVDHAHNCIGRNTPVVLLADGGGVGREPWKWLDPLNIGYLLFTQPHKVHLDYALRHSHGVWRVNGNNTCDYDYLDIKKPPSEWPFPGRNILFRTTKKTDQMQFAFAHPEIAVFTNIGLAKTMDDSLIDMGRADLLSAPAIINHFMGPNPLYGPMFPSQEDSDFHMPFLHFKPNTAYYFTRLLSQLLYASFSSDLMPRREKINTIKGPLSTLPLAL